MGFTNSSPITLPGFPALPAERFFRISLFLLLLTAVSTLSSTGKLDIFTAVLGPAAILYKGYRWWRSRPAELSPRTATYLVVAYLAILPVDIFVLSRILVANSSNPPLYAALLGAVHFVVFLTVVRLYSATTDRDAGFLVVLAFLSILASAVLTVDTAFLFFFFIFLLFGVATFVGMELRRGAKGAVWTAARADRDARFNRALGLAALSVATGAVIMGGALFFLFPRFNAGYLGRSSMSPQLTTGFNEEVELGQIGEIKKSSAIVMRVETGRPVSYERLRWRGVALATFNGKRWSAADSAGEARNLHPDANGWIYVADSSQRVADPSMLLQYTIFLEPIGTDALFVPSNPISLHGNFTGESGTAYGTSRRIYLARDSAGSLFNPFHNYTAIQYSGFSRLPIVQPEKLRAASNEYPDVLRNTYLQLPALDPRILPLAQEITERAGNPYDKSLAIESYLRAHYAYTLNLKGKPGSDPLAHFLFEARAGHCEYFASAMTIMLRTLGIPAREVNGFLPGEYNDLAGDYIVRASDAHSWVEVYFPDNGWVTFDPTPAAAAGSTGFLSRLGQYADWMELAWMEWVVSYDFGHQVVMAQNFQRTSRSWREATQAWLARAQKRGRDWVASWQSTHANMRFFLPIALLLVLFILRVNAIPEMLRRLRIFFQLRAPRTSRPNPQLASLLYTELLRLLARRGLARQDAQTPREFAAAVSEPALAPVVQEFTEVYAHARYGGAECDSLRLRELLRQIRSAPRPARP
ncbi:MAG: hypothetical protein NVS9B4_19850 [Candidatus Acidiferrum sp.]